MDRHQHARFARFGIAILAAGFAAAACEPPPPAAPVIRPVRHVVAVASGADRSRAFSGIARAGAEATLSFRVGGAITRLAVEVGESVAAGALIAELDPVDFELALGEVEADLRQAEARSGNAEVDLRRVRNLYENDNAARTDLDAAMAAAASAAAMVESTAQRLDLARRQLGFSRLTAPVAGAISEVLVEANENVSAGTPVVVLAARGAPEISFAAPEALIREIHEGMTAAVAFDAIPGARFEGAVTEVGVASTGLGTTFPVAVRLDADPGEIRSGMTAIVELVFRDERAAPRFILPGHAVGEDQTGRFVFVAEPAGHGLATVRRRPVAVAGFAEGGLEVADGIEEGDLVVTAGLNRLLDGDTVRLGTPGSR